MADRTLIVQGDLNILTRPASLFQFVFVAAVLVALSLISTANYLLFHGIVEIAGLAVAFSIFIIVWNTRRVITDGFFLITGISFLFFGSIDLVHTLAYKGMGIFPGNSPDLPTQLWIAARYFQSITFLIATLFIGRSITRDRKYDAAIIITACTAASALLFASIFVWQNFPHCFIEGSGLTPFKIASEYVISLILIATIIILYLKREHFDPVVFKLLIAAQVFLVLGELAFTSYISVFGFMNMLGHLCRLLSVYFFYRAFVVIALTRPYDLLLRDLKANEETLRESEEKYRSLFENMLEGFAYCRMIYDAEGIPVDWEYLDVNKAFGQLTGLYDIKGKRVLEAIPGIRELNPELFDSYSRVASTGISETFEIDFKPLKMWLKISVFSPHRGYFVAVFEDITRRKQAAIELESAQQSLKEAHRLAHIGRWEWMMENDTVIWSEELYAIAGRDPSLPAPTYAEHPLVYTPSSWDRLSDAVTRALTTGEPYNLELELIRPDGSIRWTNAFGGVKRDPGGKIIGLHGTLQDITWRRQAEEALRQVNSKLNLLSSITRHDINNQLFSLKAFLELSKEVLDDPAKMSEFIIKEERAANAIERQIVFTKEYQDLGVKAPVWQNVEASIKKALTTLPMRDVQVVAEAGELEVFADPLFERVFYNLIDNALRYGGQGMTTIRVSFRESEPGLIISAEDDGAGISAEDRKRLFERGFGKHTGLGLFLSREILSITGITITETGEPKKGARFEITVPKGAWRRAGQF